MVLRLGLISSEELTEKLRDRNLGVLIPCGSFEWHLSLPLSTDTIIAEKISERIAERVGYAYIPPIPYGFSIQHTYFKGTLSLSAEIYLALLKEVLSELVRNGFRNLVIVNGHGGNRGLLEAAAISVRSNKPDVKVIIFDIWEIVDELLKDKFGKTLVIGHASSVEASILLYLAPDIPSKVIKSEFKLPQSLAETKEYITILLLAQEMTTELEIKADVKLGEKIVEELLLIAEREIKEKTL